MRFRGYILLVTFLLALGSGFWSVAWSQSLEEKLHETRHKINQKRQVVKETKRTIQTFAEEIAALDRSIEAKAREIETLTAKLTQTEAELAQAEAALAAAEKIYRKPKPSSASVSAISIPRAASATSIFSLEPPISTTSFRASSF